MPVPSKESPVPSCVVILLRDQASVSAEGPLISVAVRLVRVSLVYWIITTQRGTGASVHRDAPGFNLFVSRHHGASFQYDANLSANVCF